MVSTTLLWSCPLCRQAYYYVNEATEETSWDAPILSPETGMSRTILGEEEGVPLTAISNRTDFSNKSHAAPDNGEDQALVVAPVAAYTSGSGGSINEAPFPFYVNERGNRVFYVPKTTRS